MAGKFAASSAGVKVLLTAQGFTEGSKLWQGRFEDFADVSEELTSLPV